MLRHVVLLRWREDRPQSEIEALSLALADLVATIAEVRSYQTGPDLALDSGNADFAIVAEFDDADGYRVYASHPRHLKIIREQVAPWLAERRAVQFRVSP